MSKIYWRPIAQTGPRPEGARNIAGGVSWFTHAEAISRKRRTVLEAHALPMEALAMISAPRKPVCGYSMDQARIMGILNVTPDSFSDGGLFQDAEGAQSHAQKMVSDGADFLDIGGESTRPGAAFVAPDEEIGRTVPVIKALKDAGLVAPISIDTRKAAVAEAAIKAGATLFNDVSAFSFDPESAVTAAKANVPVCLMHASGDPKTMQENPQYDNVLLDVYDYLEARRDEAMGMGMAMENIILDPGIGFGKTIDHNLELLRGLSLFHGLGCPILLGVSRKRFIGTLTGTHEARDRAPGSIAVALEAVRQGAQIIRVHDVAETRQALTLWQHLHL